MKFIRILVVFVLAAFLVVACNSSQPEAPKQLKLSEPAEQIVTKMTLQEKVGQLFMIGFYGTEPDYYLSKMINQRNIGGVILLKYNLESQDQTVKLIQDIQHMADTAYPSIPLFVSVDQEGGLVSRVQFDGVEEFTAQPDILTLQEAYDVAYKRGEELKKLGIHINYAPVVEHITDTNSFLYERVFRGGNRLTTSVLAASMLKGYSEAGIMGVPKHFPGHTNSSLNSHDSLPVEDLDSIDFLVQAYDTVLAHNPRFIMTSHVMYPKIDSVYPATLSKTILDYLKVDRKFEGLLISDDMEMKAIEANYTLEKASVMALQAGVDLLLFTSTPQKQADAYNAVVSAVQAGTIADSIIDEKVLKIIRLKQEFMLPQVAEQSL